MHTLNINLTQKNYPIYIKKGLIKNIGEELKKIYKNKKIAVITDKNVEKIYGQKIRDNLKNDFEVKIIVLEPGEKSKSIDVLQNVYNEAFRF